MAIVTRGMDQAETDDDGIGQSPVAPGSPDYFRIYTKSYSRE